jgi:YD repeat-containing protein
MSRYVGSVASKNPNEESYNFRTRPYTRSTDMTVDGSGRVTFVRYGDKTLSGFTYDAESKVTGFTEQIGSSTYTITITYDAAGDVTSVTRV